MGQGDSAEQNRDLDGAKLAASRLEARLQTWGHIVPGTLVAEQMGG
jgi:hypothetical protein